MKKESIFVQISGRNFMIHCSFVFLIAGEKNRPSKRRKPSSKVAGSPSLNFVLESWCL